MSKKIGFIGCGNMGGAIVSGLTGSGFQKNEDIIISEINDEIAANLGERLKVETVTDNKEVARVADVLFLAIKPNMYKKVIEEIKSELTREKLIITIAAGITIENMEYWIGEGYKIVRTMPNTPALVGAGMAAVCANKNVAKDEIEYVLGIFSSFGECVELEEKYFHAVTALSGSSPAYVFMFIEAMADAAVALGIPRAKAYMMASQSVLGSAKMVLNTGKHPGELKDMVCSPGGTTIDAVIELEKHGLRSAVIEGVLKCAEKSQSMQN